MASTHKEARPTKLTHTLKVMMKVLRLNGADSGLLSAVDSICLL